MTATLDDLLVELQTMNSLLRRMVVLGKTKKVIPTDGVDLPDGPCKGLILSADGDVTYIAANESGTRGAYRSAVPLVKGFNPIPVIQVWDTGTDDTLEIEALY